MSSTSDSAAKLLAKKRRLATMVVHDLRNPLTAMFGQLSLLESDLKEQGADQPSVVEAIANMRDLVARATSLCAELLAIEELEEGVLLAQRADTPIAEMLQRIAKLYRTPLAVKTVDLSVACDPDLQWKVDHKLLARVIENLLDNAVRYTPRGGRIQIVAKAGERFTLTVGNDGPAVPDDVADKVFDRYFRVEQRREAARVGRGLGLYFCKLAVLAHGGTIAVRQSDEFPTIFAIELP